MRIENDWEPIFEQELAKSYMKNLSHYLQRTRAEATVYPPKNQVFSAFKLTPYEEVKVVILGQDPYHGPNQANGLSFSVSAGISFPPSLRNIFKELVSDIGCPMPTSGDLSPWAEQGVLLLNTTLTVQAGMPMSHADKGWEIFTDFILQQLNTKAEPIVFILWGRHAQTKIKLINQQKHFVITAPHPSPLSAHRGFFGSAPFSKANVFLTVQGVNPINWGVLK